MAPRIDVAPATRDTDATQFSAILGALVARVSGAYAAALVDSEGETVDYAGRGDPFDLRVAAAHVQIAVRDVARLEHLAEPRWLILRGGQKSVAAAALPDGYTLMLLLRPRAAFTVSPRALDVCARALAAEAGWSHPERRGRADHVVWYPAEVETDHRGRPVAVGAERLAVEVLGAVVGLSALERGFRVRTSRGGELTLVREAQARWYADEPL